MFNPREIKQALVQQLNSEFYDKYSHHDLKSLVFKQFFDKDMSISDKKGLKLLVDKHIDDLAKDKEASVPTDPFKSDTIDEVMAQIQSSALESKNERVDIKSFRNEMSDRRRDAIGSEIDSIKAERNAEILKIFAESKDWTNESSKKFELANIVKVDYENNEDWTVNYKAYTVDFDNAYEVLANHLHEETTFEPVRFSGEKEVMITFEELGYVIPTSHPVSEFAELVDIEKRSDEINERYKAYEKDSQFYHNVAYILSENCEAFNSTFGSEVTENFITNGKEIARLMSLHAESNGAYDTAYKEIEDLLKNDPYKNLVLQHLLEPLKPAFTSKEYVEEYTMQIRNAKFNARFTPEKQAEYEAAVGDWDADIERVEALRDSGDLLGYKRELKELSPFHRAAITLREQEKNAESEKEKEIDSSNVVSIGF